MHDQSWNVNFPVMNDREGLPKRRSVRTYKNQYQKVDDLESRPLTFWRRLLIWKL